jgi:ABC-2 type transport system ATP-binding protein
MSVLSFHGIDKSYGDTVALVGVSLDVAEGEVFGLLGPNGAGKTSLIRILMDIVRPDRGSIHLFGHERSKRDLDRVAYLPEERGLYSKRKVLEVMVYFATLKGLASVEARERSQHWLDRFGLTHTANWVVERLSKGMGQKVQIASTLLTNPPLVVLDEPFSGLDPINVRLVQEIIQERRNAGLTTLLSTHQMNQVETLCDRVALIHRGVRVVYGTLDEVRREHSSAEVRTVFDGDPPELRTARCHRRGSADDWIFELVPGADPPDLLAELVSRGLRVRHFEQRLAPMEDIFVNVVGEPIAGEEVES